MSDRTTEATEPKGWRTAVRLTLSVSESGLLALSADEPRNLFVTGRNLEELFRNFQKFAKECVALGQPFEALEGMMQ